MDYLTEKIYNTYLRISRSKNNKPFRYRKDFDGFESDKNYLPVLKLRSFFTRNSAVNMEDFFIAPYEIFKNDNGAFYDLQFYNSLQAVKVYTIYSKRAMMDDPDSDLQLQKITDGLKFIKNFCVANKILLKDYLNFKSIKTNDFLLHLKEKNVTIYNLFPFKNLEQILKQYDFELLSFIIGDLAPRISYFRTKYYGSKKANILAKTGLKKIEKIIQDSLEKEKNHTTI